MSAAIIYLLDKGATSLQDVRIYTRKLCGFCTAAKKLLEKRGVAFRELDASFDQNLRKQMIQEANGQSTFPQIFIGDFHVGGCDDLFELDGDGKLESMVKNG